MSGFGNKSRLDADIKELHICIAAGAVKFAGSVTEEGGGYIPETDKSAYRLLFSSKQPLKHSTSPFDQLRLAIEGMCFLVHASNRLSFRKNGERLREIVYDPSVREMAHLFAKMVQTQKEELDIATMEEEFLNLIAVRELEYADASSLLGKTSDDRQSVAWVASCAISKAVGYPEHLSLIYVIKIALMQQLIDIDLSNRIKRIEALL